MVVAIVGIVYLVVGSWLYVHGIVTDPSSFVLIVLISCPIVFGLVSEYLVRSIECHEWDKRVNKGGSQ